YFWPGIYVGNDDEIDGVKTRIAASDDAKEDTNFTLPADNGTAGYVLSTDGDGKTSWVEPSESVDASSYFKIGGNAFGTGAVIGTTDAQPVFVINNNNLKLTAASNS